MSKDVALTVNVRLTSEQADQLAIVMRHVFSGKVSAASVFEWMLAEKCRDVTHNNTKDRKLDDILTEVKSLHGSVSLMRDASWARFSPPDGKLQLEVVLDDEFKDRLAKIVQMAVH